MRPDGKKTGWQTRLVAWLDEKITWRTYRFMRWYCYHYFLLRCAEVGENLTLWSPIKKPVIIGEGKVRIGNNVVVIGRIELIAFAGIFPEAELVIGDSTMIGNNVTIRAWKSIRIGAHCIIARNVQIYDNNGHPLSPLGRLKQAKVPKKEIHEVVIGNNVWIGEGAHIQDGVTIGDNTIIAPYSIVSKDVPPGVIVMGAPARVCNWLYKMFPDEDQLSSAMQRLEKVPTVADTDRVGIVPE